MWYVLIVLGVIGDVGCLDFVGVFVERYLFFKSTFERALSARAYFGFFKIVVYCLMLCFCIFVFNVVFFVFVYLCLFCLCVCGFKIIDFVNGDNGGGGFGLCVFVFVGVVDVCYLFFKLMFECVVSV